MPKNELDGKRKKKGQKAPHLSTEYLTDPSKPLPEGLNCWVFRDGVWRSATVLERKIKDGNGLASSSSSSSEGGAQKCKKRTHEEMEKELEEVAALPMPPGSDPIKDHRFLYYIHYTEWDRRSVGS